MAEQSPILLGDTTQIEQVRFPVVGAVDVTRAENLLFSNDRGQLPFLIPFTVVAASAELEVLPPEQGNRWHVYGTQIWTQTANSFMEGYIGNYLAWFARILTANTSITLLMSYSLLLPDNTGLKIKNVTAGNLTLGVVCFANRVRG